MRNIIPDGTEEDFVNAAMHLIYIDDYMEFQQAADIIWSKWPLCQPWLQWWLYNNTAKTLFRALRLMSQEAADRIPNTTSAQEAMHQFFYMASGHKHSIISGKHYY